MLTVFAKVSDYDDEIKDYCDQVNNGSLWKEAYEIMDILSGKWGGRFS